MDLLQTSIFTIHPFYLLSSPFTLKYSLCTKCGLGARLDSFTIPQRCGSLFLHLPIAGYPFLHTTLYVRRRKRVFIIQAQRFRRGKAQS